MIDMLSKFSYRTIYLYCTGAYKRRRIDCMYHVLGQSFHNIFQSFLRMLTEPFIGYRDVIALWQFLNVFQIIAYRLCSDSGDKNHAALRDFR